MKQKICEGVSVNHIYEEISLCFIYFITFQGMIGLPGFPGYNGVPVSTNVFLPFVSAT